MRQNGQNGVPDKPGHLSRARPQVRERARTLRQPLTPPEARLWARLRGRHSGFKFRRQHPIGNYIVDLFCAECNLVVELDGESHAFQNEYDERRTDWLIERGYIVIRFYNREVVGDIDAVLEKIMEACRRNRVTR
jgi:very-short-patch-repair endonuclease